MVTIEVNVKKHKLDVDDDVPLLWAIRENLHLNGTKLGCGLVQCALRTCTGRFRLSDGGVSGTRLRMF